MSDNLARVNWRMGQTLLPMHFEAQELALLANITQRMRLMGLPFYGVGRLKWNDSLLAEGILSLVHLSLILQTGELVEVPENAKVNSFNLNMTGNTKEQIFLHYLGDGPLTEEDGDDSEEGVIRKICQLEMSSEQSHSDALQTIKLAEFEKNPEGQWSLLESYIPPLLQVGTSPFLMEKMDYLNQLLELFHYKLMQEIAASYLSGENLFNAKQCLQGIYRLQRFLANLKNQVHYHPYYLYEALKTFYTELCLYQNSTPQNITNPYQHDQLAQCIQEITDPLMDQIQLIKSKSPYHPFKKKDGLFVIEKLPKEVSRAQEVYFLVQKPRVSDRISMDGVKLASLARIPVVHQLALQGIPYEKIDSPPFQHPFGAEVDFYIIIEGEEWDHALKESAVAFYDQTGFEEVNAYVYWRQG